MPVAKKCEHCGKEFKVPPRRSDEVRFCCRECKSAAGWRVMACPVCGEAFRRKKSDHAESLVSYCSKACYHASRVGEEVRNKREKTFAVCKECGKQFQITSTRKRIGGGKWCSRECQCRSMEWRNACSVAQSGEKHWRWSGGLYKDKTGYIRHKRKVLGVEVQIRNHRLVVLDAILSACPGHPFIIEVDGAKKLSPEIEVHHIDRKRDNNDLSNLLAVTKDAHAQIHHRNRKPRPWECWPPDPVAW
jgi:hypothetical protein